MSATITLTAAEAERAFQALAQEAGRLDGWAHIRCGDDAAWQLIRDAATTRVLADRFADLAAAARASESYPCDACRGSRRDRAACGHPRHANVCLSCDASLQHAGADR